MTLIPSGPFAGLLQNGYEMILADPAWAWVNFSGVGSAPHRTKDEPYRVMSIEELRALPVADLAAKNCILIMWVIGSHIDQAIELGRHYGFTFKSDGFVWVKVGKNDPTVRPISMGKWVRKQTEYTLLFTKGKPARLDAGVRQLFETDEHVIYAPRREHSRKPDEQYSRCERLAAGPRVELFSRTRREGWDCWGNEAGRFSDPIDPLLRMLDTPADEFADLLG